MPTKEELLLLQSELYATYLAAGWNLKQRSVSALTNLLHSEVSEAMEGNRRNLMDNHLEHYKMEVVEVADTTIRALNWMADMGYTDPQVYSEAEVGEFIKKASGLELSEMDFMDYLAELHDCISNNRKNLMQLQTKPDTWVKPVNSLWLWRVVAVCFVLADKKGWDLMAVIREKNAYNAIRPDHTLAERAKEHGKGY